MNQETKKKRLNERHAYIDETESSQLMLHCSSEGSTNRPLSTRMTAWVKFSHTTIDKMRLTKVFSVSTGSCKENVITYQG